MLEYQDDCLWWTVTPDSHRDIEEIACISGRGSIVGDLADMNLEDVEVGCLDANSTSLTGNAVSEQGFANATRLGKRDKAWQTRCGAPTLPHKVRTTCSNDCNPWNR